MTEDCSNYFNKLSLLWDMNEKISPSSIPIGNQHKTVVVVDHSPGFGVMSNHVGFFISESRCESSQFILGYLNELAIQNYFQ